MEVFRVPTPTYSGNYKANLESFPVEYTTGHSWACRNELFDKARALVRFGQRLIAGPEFGLFEQGGCADHRIGQPEISLAPNFRRQDGNGGADGMDCPKGFKQASRSQPGHGGAGLAFVN